MNQKRIDETKKYIAKHVNTMPEIGLVLGSGLGVLAEEIEQPTVIPYGDIPHFPVSTVAGHAGQLVIGKLEGKHVLAMQGRFHFYEGYPMDEVVYPIRVMKKLGIETIFITNAAGGLNVHYKPGDLMIITDHINRMGTNPLIGPNDESLGVRFPDMSNAYDESLIKHALKCAKDLSMNVHTGIYVGNTGPMYETPTEVNMLQKMGGDAVGMSTVPEVIAARHAQMQVLGISCISNLAAGLLDQPLSHEEVIETTEMAKVDFIRLMKYILKTL